MVTDNVNDVQPLAKCKDIPPYCRFCFEDCIEDSQGDGSRVLKNPCKCQGTLETVHAECLLTWISKNKKNFICSGCRSPFNLALFKGANKVRLLVPHPPFSVTSDYVCFACDIITMFLQLNLLCQWFRLAAATRYSFETSIVVLALTFFVIALIGLIIHPLHRLYSNWFRNRALLGVRQKKKKGQLGVNRATLKSSLAESGAHE
ncbi:unnamed protein product [Cyprideis torosa]|uniref:Uncharacterized protein n=1 Tax=Cyprideis torosa TaxID=163714 RepID=A0A7R8ZJI1_9CRUS|nr:unnamed protein product [Cyprideis torosa]CAG0882304.1 unnamed protein product [Cyprideis torosa]